MSIYYFHLNTKYHLVILEVKIKTASVDVRFATRKWIFTKKVIKMPNPEGSRNVYLKKSLAGLLTDEDVGALLTKLGHFLNTYCFWKKEGKEYLKYNDDLNRALTKLQKRDELNAVH